jgi:hypothetical protein
MCKSKSYKKWARILMKWLEGMRDLCIKGPCPCTKGRAEERKRSCALLYLKIG